MELVWSVVKFLMDHWQDILTAVIGLLSALIVIFIMVPGPHPEDWLQKAVDFLSKFSRKKPDDQSAQGKKDG